LQKLLARWIPSTCPVGWLPGYPRVVPFGHASHKNCVSSDEYSPAGHGSHVLDPAMEVNIGKQFMHSVKVWAPILGLYFPAKQDWHVLAP
jgi:hypothetical protein